MKEINIEEQLKDIDRGYYDFFNEFIYSDITEKGLNADIVNEISDKKNEPDWMRKRRLKSLELYEKIDNPSKQVEEKSVISVRKCGKFILDEIGGVSKKGKTRLKIKIFK